MNFKEWLKIEEMGTMSGGGGTGTNMIAQFKQPVGIGLVRRGHRKKKDGSHKRDIDTIIDKT